MKRLRKTVGLFLLIAVLGLSFPGWFGTTLGAFAYQGDVPNLVISDNNKKLTLDCGGAAAIVNGNHNTISLLGTCFSLTVRGNKNAITLEAPTVVTDTGNNNTIAVLQTQSTSPPTPTSPPPSLTDTPLTPTNTPQDPTLTPQPPTTTPSPPTNTPESPSTTPQAPTVTPQTPTDTPQTPTGTPTVSTNTPQPVAETPAVDTEAPTVRWIGPVAAGERYDLREGEQVLLEAEVSDNVGVIMVRFLWWDAVNERYVTLGTFTQPPFRLQINANSLNSEWNQLFVVALDESQNRSDFASIWLYKLVLPGSQSGYQMFLPLTGK